MLHRNQVSLRLPWSHWTRDILWSIKSEDHTRNQRSQKTWWELLVCMCTYPHGFPIIRLDGDSPICVNPVHFWNTNYSTETICSSGFPIIDLMEILRFATVGAVNFVSVAGCSEPERMPAHSKRLKITRQDNFWTRLWEVSDCEEGKGIILGMIFPPFSFNTSASRFPRTWEDMHDMRSWPMDAKVSKAVMKLILGLCLSWNHWVAYFAASKGLGLPGNH